MPEAEYSTTARLPVPMIWAYVREMDNWAPFLRGYQSHERQSDTDSVWVLKGDVMIEMVAPTWERARTRKAFVMTAKKAVSMM